MGCAMSLGFTTRIFRCGLAVSLFSYCGIAQPPPQSPSGRCDSRELKYGLSAKDPAYGSAMQLVKTLSRQGINVNCVLPSKMVNFFVGQRGAALLRTDHGDFEALFAFEAEQFAYLAVVERPQEDNLHTYDFYGTPTVRTMQGRKHFFLKHDITFFVTMDERLARSLAEIYGEQSRLNP